MSGSILAVATWPFSIVTPICSDRQAQPLGPFPITQFKPGVGPLRFRDLRHLPGDLGLDDPHYSSVVDTPVHPYFIAGRMAPLTRHNFTYGPTIHVRSQIQHRQEGIAGREIVINAQIVDAYDRKGHWYQVLDGVVTTDQGSLAQLRHTTIFRPRQK